MANAANARENVASLGTAPARVQPHSRRSVLSICRRSISARVVGTSNTAFAKNARASARRSSGGRPGPPGHAGSTTACTRPVPRSHRVLIEMQGSWREHEPMRGDDFEPLAP